MVTGGRVKLSILSRPDRFTAERARGCDVANATLSPNFHLITAATGALIPTSATRLAAHSSGYTRTSLVRHPPLHSTSSTAMSISRSESQYSRRRSNTTLSAFKNTHPPPPPLEVGASKVLIVWVHSTGDPSSVNVILNHSYLPGVAPGDLLRVTTTQLHEKSGFLFVVPNEDPNIRAPLQVGVILHFPWPRKPPHCDRYRFQSLSLRLSTYEILQRSP